MVQQELIGNIAESCKIDPGEVRRVLDELSNQISAIRPGDEIRTTILGIFSVTHKPAHMAHNPKTLVHAEVQAKNVMKFKPAKRIRDAINA